MGSPGSAAGAERFARGLCALPEGGIRAGAAARRLSRMEPAEAVVLLAALVRAAGERWGGPALAAVGQALLDPPAGLGYGWRADAYAEARARSLPEVAALFLSPAPRRSYEAPRDRSDPVAAALTLGHKKSLARLRRDPDLLSRLAAEGEPSVLKELLRNPLVTEEVAARLAARRPVRPEALRVLHEDPRFRNRLAVRRALARNPYVETGIALHLLPTLPRAAVVEIAADATLHPVVREAARRLLASRG